MHERIHCRKSAGRTACKRQHKKRRFADPELTLDRLSFINSESGKGNKIDCNKPYEQNFPIHMLLSIHFPVVPNVLNIIVIVEHIKHLVHIGDVVLVCELCIC